ncbi:MAG: hypothetical protein KDE45_13230, partial [Caldilineaceae bacterium]|nr:hypothetical protein [Caldilineaceae bacterium]
MKEPHDTLVAYLAENDIGSGASRSLALQPGQVAVVGRAARPQVVATPGSHLVRSAWEAFLGKDVPPVWLITQHELVLHPRLGQLPAYENVPMEADFLMQVRIADPLRFWQTYVGGKRDSISASEVAETIGREIHPILAHAARQYPAQGLAHGARESQAVQATLADALQVLCHGAGMEMLNVTHLGFRRQADAVELAERAVAIQRRLEEIELESRINRLENEQVWKQAQADFADDLTEADQAEIKMQAETGEDAAAFEKIVNDKLDAMRDMLEEAMANMSGAAAVEPASTAMDAATEERFYKWIAVLRVAGAALSLTVALSAIWFPEFIPDGRGAQAVAASLGFLAAVAAFASAWFLHHRLRQRQAEATRRAAQSAEDAERIARIAQERGIRRYLEQRLRQASQNCDQSWQRIYPLDMDAATALRQHCAGQLTALADQVQSADFPTSRYMAQRELALPDLAQLVALSQQALDASQQLVDLSQKAYNAAVDG